MAILTLWLATACIFYDIHWHFIKSTWVFNCFLFVSLVLSLCVCTCLCVGRKVYPVLFGILLNYLLPLLSLPSHSVSLSFSSQHFIPPLDSRSANILLLSAAVWVCLCSCETKRVFILSHSWLSSKLLQSWKVQ